jgi:hypothetical protein
MALAFSLVVRTENGVRLNAPCFSYIVISG